MRRTFLSQSDARLWEEKVLRRLNAVKSEHWLNKQNAGTEFYCLQLSEDHRRKISNSHKGKCVSEETKQRLRTLNIGRKFGSPSIETRKKISESNKGKPGPNLGKSFSSEHRQKIGKGNSGKVRTSEQNLRNSETQKGKIISEETRKKMSESQKKRQQTQQSPEVVG